MEKKYKEHENDMPHCWCNPTKEVFENGNMVITHNEPEIEVMGWESEFNSKFFVSGINANGSWVPMLFPSKGEVREYIREKLEEQKADFLSHIDSVVEKYPAFTVSMIKALKEIWPVSAHTTL